MKLQAGKCSFEEKLPGDFPQYYEKNRQLTYKMYAVPGNTWSDPITLSVDAPDPPTLTLTNSHSEVNGYADFLCIAGGGYRLSLVLLKVTGNGTRLISSSATTRLVFRLHNTKCEDTENYYCQAENSLGQANSTFVRVSCSPQLLGNTKRTYQVKVTEGSNGQFLFELTAQPVPTIESFTFHIGDVSSSEQEPVRSGLLSGQCDRHVLNLHLVVCTLNITAPTDRESGSYNVKFGNSLGSMKFAFELSVIDHENPDNSSSLPWIEMLIGLLLVALIAAFIVFLIRKQKGALRRKANKKRILCDTGISAEEPIYYNVAANVVARQPSDEHVTPGTSVSEKVYLNVEKNTSSHNRDESTEENFQSALYAVVDRTRKISFLSELWETCQASPSAKTQENGFSFAQTGSGWRR